MPYPERRGVPVFKVFTRPKAHRICLVCQAANSCVGSEAALPVITAELYEGGEDEAAVNVGGVVGGNVLNEAAAAVG